MTGSSSIFLKASLGLLLLFLSSYTMGQDKDSNETEARTDSSSMNMDAPYQRPFRSPDRIPLNLGGYLEVNSLYKEEEGISEGFSFQARRLTLFMSTPIARRISFLSEIEFEKGGEEIAIEFAALDVGFHPLFNLRTGIIMNPVGSFNQNHDGPNWEFVERPNVSERLLPATWSNAGFGVYGKSYHDDWILGYEAYLTNGFDASIIDNERNKTYLPASKENAGRFEESFSGEPLVTGKVAIKHQDIGELGFSYMGGVYNRYRDEDLDLGPKRRLDVWAVDLRTTLPVLKTKLIGEAAFSMVDVPDRYTQRYGDEQRGFFLDVVQPLIDRPILGWEDASLNLAARLDYVDWNVGRFRETGNPIGDELWAVTPAISFRTSQNTVLRLNYRYEWHRDILRNPPVRAASWMLGLSSYF